MNPDDLKPAAPLFKRIDRTSPDAKPFYDMISNALVWTDELPHEHPKKWSAIRPVLRHRTCMLIGVASEYEGWWQLAQSLFPQWIGFDICRCTASEELRLLFVRSEEEARRSLERFISHKTPES